MKKLLNLKLRYHIVLFLLLIGLILIIYTFIFYSKDNSSYKSAILILKTIGAIALLQVITLVVSSVRFLVKKETKKAIFRVVLMVIFLLSSYLIFGLFIALHVVSPDG